MNTFLSQDSLYGRGANSKLRCDVAGTLPLFIALYDSSGERRSLLLFSANRFRYLGSELLGLCRHTRSFRDLSPYVNNPEECSLAIQELSRRIVMRLCQC